MISFLLFLIAIASFIFYGVVGQDKTWLLAPAFLLTYSLVTMRMFSKAWRMEHGVESRREPATSNQQPVTALLWVTFLLYGIAVIPQAVVPFESKLTMLFVGGVVGAYLVWGSELTTFKDNRILLGALIFVVMLTALYGLIVHFKCPDRVLWAERYAIYEGRLMSTYICPNHFAHLMVMLMPFCVALLFIPQAGIFLRLLCAYSLLAFLPPLFLTESRSGWLGSIAATGVVLCLMALRRSKKLFLVLVLVVPVCSFLLLLAGWKYSETFQRRAEPVVEFLLQQSEEGVGSESKDFRPQTWMDTIDMIKEAPLIGFGPGNYRYAFPEHRMRFQGKRIVTGHPHNEYLELMADYGLIGFGLFALAWCYGLVRILIASLKAEETRHAFIGFAFLGTAAATMVHSFFDFQMHVYPNALVFALLAALAWGPLASARKRKQPAADSGQLESGKAALESGGSTPLSAKNSGLLVIADASNLKPHTSNTLCPLWLNKPGAWLLAVGYLLGTLFCIQTMSSAFVRALGDKRSEAPGTRHLALEDKHSPAKMYSLAIRLDPQNGRAYKGMGNQLFDRRYYSLEMDEKVRLAEQERSWYEKAYGQNPKDPEVCMAYGKVLIFLGKNKGTRNSALGTRVDEGTTGMSSDGSQRTASGPEGPTPRREDSIQHTADSKQPAENRGLKTDYGGPGASAIASGTSTLTPPATSAQLLKPNNDQPTPDNQLQASGLELLREACRYRPFNDVYWWNLGVELRKAGRYEEGLDVFHHAASIKRTPSTKKNIEWLEARLKAVDSENTASGVGSADDETALQANKVKSKEDEGEEWTMLSPTNATVDRGLMDLLNKMGE